MRRLISLVLAALLLTGCSEPVQEIPRQTSEAPPVVSVCPEPPAEPPIQSMPASIEVFPLHEAKVLGMTAMGDRLLVLSEMAERTVLSALDSRQLECTASYVLKGVTFPTPGMLHIGMSGFSYYCDEEREIVQVDGNLQEVRRIQVPQGIVGAPIFSQDYGICYYGTADGLWAWDVDSGVTTILLKDPAPYKNMENLLYNDQILQCALGYGDEGSYLYLNTADGSELWRDSSCADVKISRDQFYATVAEGRAETLLFGTMGQEPVSLVPREDYGKSFFFPQSHRAICCMSDSRSLKISCYDLASGLRTAEVSLPGSFLPFQAAEIGGRIYLLAEDDLGQSVLCWDASQSPVTDSTVYTGTYFTPEAPDQDGLQHCLDYASQLSQRHGVEILVWERAVEVPPWDYNLTPEYLVPVIMRQLQLLDGRLQNYPEGMLRALSEDCGGLRISLVREITGKENSGSLSTAKGLQYWDKQGGNYIVLAHDTEYTLYHELCHVIDNYIEPRSDVFEAWNDLNPKGFQYDMDYQKNVSRDGSQYLKNSSRSFIDTYSMSFPTEDRARIMEYAMTSDNEFLFTSSTMQKKLYLLSYGIRQVFGLLDSPRQFLWEQYLDEPFRP